MPEKPTWKHDRADDGHAGAAADEDPRRDAVHGRSPFGEGGGAAVGGGATGATVGAAVTVGATVGVGAGVFIDALRWAIFSVIVWFEPPVRDWYVSSAATAEALSPFFS